MRFLGILVKVLLCLVLAVVNASCGPAQSILIGVAVELTGKRAELGVEVRDAVLLAVEKLNQSDGVAGKTIQLLIKDDQGNPEVARQVDQELIAAGVVAVVGHVTSEQTAAVLDQMNKAGVVLISPTSSSSEFTGKVDTFFRTVPANDMVGRMLARYMVETRQIHELVGVYDLNNRSFTETFWKYLRDEFEQLGGKIAADIPFYSGQDELPVVAGQAASLAPQAVVIIASAVDTALVVQYFRQVNQSAAIFSSTWAQTSQLLEKGGRVIEGLELAAVYDPQEQSQSYLGFVSLFEQRYHRLPGLGASHAFEAVIALSHALEETGGTKAGLPEALTAIKSLPGLQDDISFDEFGDVQRDVYIVKVQDGQFVTVGKVDSYSIFMPKALTP
jgi:branched-chain amino acid transport system substrate-binding protein